MTMRTKLSRNRHRPRRTTSLNHGAGPGDRPFESQSLFGEAARRWTASYLAECIARTSPALSQQRVRQLAEEWARVEPPCLAFVMFSPAERAAMLAEGLTYFSIETMAIFRLVGCES